MRKVICLLTIAQLTMSAADAHSWYPKECCSDDDCRPVPCTELTQTNLGMMWRGRVIFNEMQTHESLDQFCHVCIKANIDILPYLPICVFVPRVTSEATKISVGAEALTIPREVPTEQLSARGITRG